MSAEQPDNEPFSFSMNGTVDVECVEELINNLMRTTGLDVETAKAIGTSGAVQAQLEPGYYELRIWISCVLPPERSPR